MTFLVQSLPLFIVIVLVGLWWFFFLMHRAFQKRRLVLEKRIIDLQDALRKSKIRSAHMLLDRERRSQFHASLMEKLPFRINELMTATDNRQLANHLIDLVVDLFEPSEAVLFTFVPSRRKLVLSAAHGVPSSRVGHCYDLTAGRLGAVVTKGITMTTRDFLNESIHAKRHIRLSQAPECQQDVLTPLISNNQVIGVLGLKRISHDLNLEEIQMFKMVAQLAGIAFAFRSMLTQYKTMAHQDGLTGLVNKQQFMIMLGDMLINASIMAEPVSIFMLDIDYFKNYNDRNGHLEGDRLLRELSQLIRRNIREGDVAARYGGEEFIIAFPAMDRKRAGRVAEFLRRTIEMHPFPHRSGQPSGFLSVSGGIATYPEDGDSGAELIRVADARLYEAKNRGRNKIVTYR